jgi:hypothetical protein
MNKEFTPYQEALELKKLGFNEPCFGYYYEDMSILYTGIFSQNTNSFWLPSLNKIFTAPTYSQAFRWFREKYNLHILINVKDGIWYFERFSINGFKTYEEAELECLRKLIQMVKGGNND